MAQRQIQNLDDLMDGGVTERFNAELKRVLENVFDMNTDAKAVRNIQLTITIRPNERRDAAEFNAKVTAKIAPPVPMSQTVFLAQTDSGTVTATEITNQVSGQIGIDGSEVIPKVFEFGGLSKVEGSER